MTNQDDDWACDYVLDRLSAEDRRAFEHRLASEPELCARVSAYEQGLAERLSELPQRSPRPAVWDRIERAAGKPLRSTGLRWVPLIKWGIAAVIALSLASLALERWFVRPYIVVLALDSHSGRPIRLAPSSAGDPNASFIQLASLATARWENGADRRAFAMFDPASSQGFIAVRNLPTAGIGRHYQVWILDTGTGAVRAAGALPASGLYSFAVDPIRDERSDHLRVLVTRETATGAGARPGPDVVLGG